MIGKDRNKILCGKQLPASLLWRAEKIKAEINRKRRRHTLAYPLICLSDQKIRPVFLFLPMIPPVQEPCEKIGKAFLYLVFPGCGVASYNGGKFVKRKPRAVRWSMYRTARLRNRMEQRSVCRVFARLGGRVTGKNGFFRKRHFYFTACPVARGFGNPPPQILSKARIPVGSLIISLLGSDSLEMSMESSFNSFFSCSMKDNVSSLFLAIGFTTSHLHWQKQQELSVAAALLVSGQQVLPELRRQAEQLEYRYASQDFE